ncbi:GNAT family N-acetyltransferase [[Bacillus] enclensis]|uniref:GNAT family N-acetyltransferase n=1 Tax=[Bacillus] enclensis TaxID=1402860 RepID=UPI0018DC0A68|nr:GNAT family N-acetyltransferase [[Bacillus] enclensis]MBH9964907.1 GNAT family N-acetyltransferase [[Bacillus] enclensis]
MILQSERLQFRNYTDTDLDFLHSLLSDPEMVRYIGDGKTRDLEGAEKFLNWIYHTYTIGRDLGLMVLETKSTKTRIGHAGLVPQMINGKNEMEIGYWISKDYWGSGYAKEAALVLMDIGRDQLDISRFIALIQLGNTPSKKVAGKLGMTIESEIVLNGQKVQVYSISY